MRANQITRITSDFKMDVKKSINLSNGRSVDLVGE